MGSVESYLAFIIHQGIISRDELHRAIVIAREVLLFISRFWL